MPTRRWMYIVPISFLCVAAELIIMFGFRFEILRRPPLASEELAGKFYVLVVLMVGQAGL